jgi:hypothetical protein
MQYSTKKNSGEVLGVVNTFNMLGGGILQQFIGIGLDFQWNGEIDEFGTRAYSSEQFINSLSILSLVIIFCCIVSMKLIKSRKTL